MNVYNQNTTTGTGVYSVGYNVPSGSPWIGYQFNTITLRMRSPTTSGVQLFVYDSIGNPLADSGGSPITVTTEQLYVIPLTATVTIATSVQFQFECTGSDALQFAVFTTSGAPLTTMSPILYQNIPPAGYSIVPFAPSFGTGGFVCVFSLV
jgi:hypothetical protein